MSVGGVSDHISQRTLAGIQSTKAELAPYRNASCFNRLLMANNFLGLEELLIQPILARLDPPVLRLCCKRLNIIKLAAMRLANNPVSFPLVERQRIIRKASPDEPPRHLGHSASLLSTESLHP